MQHAETSRGGCSAAAGTLQAQPMQRALGAGRSAPTTSCPVPHGPTARRSWCAYLTQLAPGAGACGGRRPPLKHHQYSSRLPPSMCPNAVLTSGVASASACPNAALTAGGRGGAHPNAATMPQRGRPTRERRAVVRNHVCNYAVRVRGGEASAAAHTAFAQVGATTRGKRASSSSGAVTGGPIRAANAQLE